MSPQDDEHQHATLADIADGFELYNARCSIQDYNFIRGCNQTMDTLLVFAGLFSAIVTAFMVQNLQLLSDNSQKTNELLLIISMQLNATFPANASLDDKGNNGPTGSEKANIIFSCSLTITLLTALAAILVKQWVHVYRTRMQLGETSQEKARARATSWRGVQSYRLEVFISVIPMLLHLGLALFFGGLLAFFQEGNSFSTFIVTCILVAIGCIAYLALGIIYSSDPTSPFQWPFSVGLRILVKLSASASRRLLSKRRNLKAEGVSLYLLQPVVPTKSVTLAPLYNTTIRSGPDCNVQDLQILLEVVSNSYSILDICRAMEQVRSIMLLPDFRGELLRTSAEIRGLDQPHSTLDLILLNACNSIIASSISYTGFSLPLYDTYLQAARYAASFLETYLQFHSEDAGLPNECLELIKGAQIQDLAAALLRVGLEFTNGLPSDIVLGISLRAKVSHLGCRKGESCKRCLTELVTTRKLTESLKKLLRNGDPTPQRLEFIHHLTYIFFTTLSECLLTYFKPDDAEWQFIIDNYQKPLAELFDDLSQNTPRDLIYTHPMRKLRSFAQQKTALNPNDERLVAWFEIILSYCSPARSSFDVRQKQAVFRKESPIQVTWLDGVQDIPEVNWDPHPYELSSSK
ncbi:hypothetical protein FRC17_005037 [Serendipita sp. 399]|nr:hypothetical protein FRC17_005037 [Serendipita sp. 399]